MPCLASAFPLVVCSSGNESMIRSSPLFSRPIRPSALRFADSGPLCALWLGEASAEAVACPSGSLPPPFREIRSAYLSLSLTASRPPSHPQAARVQTRAAVDFYGPDRAKYVSTSHAVGPARPLTRSLTRLPSHSRHAPLPPHPAGTSDPSPRRSRTSPESTRVTTAGTLRVSRPTRRPLPPTVRPR